MYASKTKAIVYYVVGLLHKFYMSRVPRVNKILCDLLFIRKHIESH